VLYSHFPEPEEGPYRNDGTCETHFWGSTDGIEWNRYDRAPYAVPRGDERMLYMGHGLVVRGDEYWQYGVAYRTSHGQAKLRVGEGDGTIVRFVQRADRFVSADYEDGGGELTTRPVRYHGGPLTINADAASGALRVEIQDIQGRAVPGFELEHCEPVSVDDTRARVTWHGQEAGEALRGREVCFHIKAQRSRLFAITFGE
jgi:hypothetical protein